MLGDASGDAREDAGLPPSAGSTLANRLSADTPIGPQGGAEGVRWPIGVSADGGGR